MAESTGIAEEADVAEQCRPGGGQNFTRWFTVYPKTHVKKGQTVEVTPVSEAASSAGLTREEWQSVFRAALEFDARVPPDSPLETKLRAALQEA